MRQSTQLEEKVHQLIFMTKQTALRRNQPYQKIYRRLVLMSFVERIESL